MTTAAAAIMVIIFSSFVLGDDPIVKTFGIGLAVAVLADARLVRMVLVPATMELLGDANWWLPEWLDRRLPRIELEASAPGEPVPAGPSAVERAPEGGSVSRRRRSPPGAMTWLGSLSGDQRGQAVAQLDRAFANGAVDAARRNGRTDVVVPLGRGTRSLTISDEPGGFVLDVRSGRAGDDRTGWHEVRDRMPAKPRRGRLPAGAGSGRGRERGAVAARDARHDPEELARHAGTSFGAVERLEGGDRSAEIIDLIGVSLVLDACIDRRASGSEAHIWPAAAPGGSGALAAPRPDP